MVDGLDRVRRPDPRRPRVRDPEGKDALYTVAPSAGPPAYAYVRCAKCSVERGLSLREVASILRPPWLLNPLRPTRLWARCPSCEQRGWLDVRRGEGALRLRQRPSRDG